MSGKERIAIIVAGMHRSGTSVTTRIASLLGAELARDLIPAGIGNERGHWESRAVQSLHNEMLGALGSDLYSPLNIADDWFASRSALPWIARMRDLLASEYPSSDLFVIKDPRITLFLPLWSEALGQSAISARFVIPFRQPDAVATSLEMRERRLESGNPLPHAQGVAVWLRYVLAAERFTRDQIRTFVAFDAVRSDWRAEFARMAGQLGIAWPNWQRSEAEIDEYLDGGAHGGSVSARVQDVGAVHQDVHAGLIAAVQAPHRVFPQFDAAAQAVAIAESVLGAHVAARERALDDMRHRADTAAQQRDSERAAMHAQFAAEIKARDALLAEATEHARRLEEARAILQRDHHRLVEIEAARDSERAAIHARFAAEIDLREGRLAELAAELRRQQEILVTLEREHGKASEYALALAQDRDRALAYAATLQESRDEAIEYAQSLEQARTREQRSGLLASDGLPVFFTIASRNYLAYALTLMQSVAAQYPDAPRYLILADREEGDPALIEAPFITIAAETLALPDFEAFAFRYGIMEFNTAIKPYAFAELRRRHPGVGIIYLDPDILVVEPLIEVESALAAGALAVLTPHLLEAVDDDRHPGEREMLLSGTYNCGFFAVGAHPDADSLIAWWARRLEFGAFSDIAAGLFTDQKWVDLVPGLFADVHILRDEGYNLAYWNVSQRKVSRRGSRWYAGKRPLAFVHFSGVDVDRPAQFSKHQNRHTQATIGALRPLYMDYLDRLAANGHAEHRGKPYAFGRFADGELICDPVRAVFRRHFDKGAAQPQRQPFSMDRRLYDLPCDELPRRADAPVTRVMYATWKMRADLRRAFDLNQAEGRDGFMRWFVRTAGAEMGIPDRHFETLQRALAAADGSDGARSGMREKPRSMPWPLHRTGSACLEVIAWSCRYRIALRIYAMIPETMRNRIRRRLEHIAFAGKPLAVASLAPCTDVPGINLIGYARGEFGVAEILRRHAYTLHDGGVPFVVRNFDIGVASRQSDRSMDVFLAEECRYGVNLFCINADQMAIAHRQLGNAVFAGRYNIACWFWELEKFPAHWHDAIEVVDEIWVSSPFVRDAIAASTHKPVHIVPVALQVHLPERYSRSGFGLHEGAFLCLFSFDFNSFAVRKNAEGTIAAFRRAFSDDRRDVRLLIKTTNGDRFPDALQRLIDSVGGDDRIEVRDGFLERREMWALQACCDCYVSLHRSEGLGLGMAECMLLGKPVVATAYSGNLAFMDADNSCLVGYSLVPVVEGEYPAWQGQHWAEPDIDEAALHLRKLADDPAYARSLGERAKASVQQRLSTSTSLAAIGARLADIRVRQAG